MNSSRPRTPPHASGTVLPTGGGLPDAAPAEQAIAQLLGPVAKLMIDQGVQLGQVVEQLKSALVQQASESFQSTKKESTESRIALLTGVHRKDVKRLRQTDPQAPFNSRSTPVHMAVVSRWISEPHYLNTNQTPRPLAKTAAKALAGEPNFTSLVAQISKDVGARVVLDELLRLGIVHIQDDDLIALNGTSFVPKGHNESLALLAANVHDHLAAAVHNVNPGRAQDLFLEQSAFSNGLTPALAEELHGLARQLWARALQQFLQAATIAEERSQATHTESSARHSIRFGVYFHDQGPVTISEKTMPKVDNAKKILRPAQSQTNASRKSAS